MERQQFVDAALSVVGLGANPKDPYALVDYTNLIAPGETEQRANSMLSMSDCGLVVAGIWRKAGVVHPSLDPPYIDQTAISRLTTLAHKYGAWVNFSQGSFPEPGDMVLIGDNGAGGTEHVFTVVEISSDGAHLVSVDGGQRDDDHYETILKKNRIWKGQSDLTPPSSRRKICGWINCTLLPSS